MRPHGTWAKRELGETNSAARGEEAESTSSCQASGAIRCDPQRAGDREFRCRRGERAPGDRTLEGVTPILGTDGIRQRVGQLCQCRIKFGLIDHPVHGSGRLTDHAQARVGGDPDVGEPQNQGGRLGVRHGHVAQVGAEGGHVAAVPLARQRAIARQYRTGVRVHLQWRQRTESRQRRARAQGRLHRRRPGRTRRRFRWARQRSRCRSSRRSPAPARR